MHKDPLPPAPPTDDPSHLARDLMVLHQLRGRGIKDAHVLAAMSHIPRELFLREPQRRHAYEDSALPSLSGQTISQPYMVAAMTEALAVSPGHQVLEIGTGTGYQTAILAELANPGLVCTIECLPELHALAQQNLSALGLQNVRFAFADGSQGWPDQSATLEFERILITAGAPQVPATLRRQLRDGGIMVVPVGARDSQVLLRIERRGNRYLELELMECRFVPLVGAEAWKQH